jgi:spore germination cell wall hydrolase CwlJ-like protein
MQKVKLCQFSWVCESKAEPNKNSTRYKQAEQVAYEVLVNDAYTDIVPKSTLFFHNLSVDPLWPYKQVAKIGNHIFYSKAKKPTQKPTVKSENDI